MPRIPHVIPAVSDVLPGMAPPPDSGDEFSLYDVAINGIGFMYASTTENPAVRETADYVKDRLDQAETPGEQTLTNWWLKSQESFHGGAGQLNLEPPFETPQSHVRYRLSKNVDPFTPGLVTRLPDTKLMTPNEYVGLVALDIGGQDMLAGVTQGGNLHTIRDVIDDIGDVTALPPLGVKSIATDGAKLYFATNTTVSSYDIPTGTQTTLATFAAAAVTTPVLGWAKARLMLAVNGGIYEIDVTVTNATLSPDTCLFQHPTPGWTWRCFSDTPSQILVAGDAGQVSTVETFQVAPSGTGVGGGPVLQPQGTMLSMPIGERILSMANVMGTFQAIGTTRGIRIGEFNVYTSKLALGPLTLTPVDPTIPAAAMLTRDRFAYAVGMAYDEAGLIAVDLGTAVDQAGRYAWAPHLIGPEQTSTPATAACALATDGRFAFSIPGQGLVLEGDGPGTGREAWLQTSRIRYGTTEPKLFKLGTVRADLTNSTVKVSAMTEATTQVLATQGFTSVPPDFQLPSASAEWLALTFTFSGTDVQFRSYAVKALPGTRRQRNIRLVLSINDRETGRSGQQIRDQLKARDRLNALEALDSAGDTVVLEEFTPTGVIRTLAVVNRVTFTQIGRPTKTSDVGGTAAVLLRTVES